MQPKHPISAPTAEITRFSTAVPIQDFEAVSDRTERLGLCAPPVQLVVRKDCVDVPKTMPVLLDYFDRHDPAVLVGQTATIHFALVPRLMRETGIPFQLGKPREMEFFAR